MDRSIVLSEWERRPRGPEQDEALAGLSFEDPAIERAARALRQGGRLLVSEARHGLSIEARAHVGVVQLGPLRVTILPKIATEDLWYILAYGLGLDVVDRRFPAELLLPDAPFTDVLALLLLEEANALLRRGLRRGYSARSGWLELPRGRLELARLASAWPLSEAALPCAWHELLSDTLDNQVVRAGLHFCWRQGRGGLSLYSQEVPARNSAHVLSIEIPAPTLKKHRPAPAPPTRRSHDTPHPNLNLTIATPSAGRPTEWLAEAISEAVISA